MVRSKKTFYVIAYDVRDNKRRRKVVKAVELYGGRINLSVFECMLDSGQLEGLLQKLEGIIDKSEDQLAFYPLCLNCFAKVHYLPEVRRTHSVVKVV